MIAAQAGYPAFLSDFATLDLTIANGQTKPLNSQKMSNIFGCAIAIDELHFSVLPNPMQEYQNSIANALKKCDLGSFITAAIRVGNLNLMSKGIHLRSLGTRWQDGLQVQATSYNRGGTLNVARYMSTFYRWVLDQPLYIGRNSAIDVSIGADPIAQRPNDPSNFMPGVDVHVAAVGRLVPDQKQSNVEYPYVMEFAATSGMPATPFFAKNNPDLLNPFYNPLLIRRLVPSLYGTLSGLSSVSTDLISAGTNARNVTAKLWDSRGNNIAGYGGGDPVPMNMLCDRETGEWDLVHQLDAGQWYNLELYCNASGLGFSALWPRLAFHGSHMAQFVP